MGVWGSAVQGPHRTRLEDRVEYAQTAVRAHAEASAGPNRDCFSGFDFNSDLAGALGLDSINGDVSDDATAAGRDPGSEPDAVIHLLCDLMHLAMELEADFSALLTSAQHHFVEERLLR